MDRTHASGTWANDRLAGQAIRYFVVAGAGYVFALAAYGIALKIGMNPYLAVVTVFVLNGIFNFVGFRVWAFPRSNSHASIELARFFGVAVFSLALNYTFFAALFEIVRMDAFPAQAVAVVLVAPLGFAANRLWTFRFAGKHRALAEPLIRAAQK